MKDLFELPTGAKSAFDMRSPWKQDRDVPVLKLQDGKPHTFNLQLFEVLILETK